MDLLALSSDVAPLKSNILVRYDSEQQRDDANKVASDSVISVSSSSNSWKAAREMNAKLLKLASPTPTPRCKVSHWLDLCSPGNMYQRPQVNPDGAVPFAGKKGVYSSLDFIEDEAKRTASILFRQDFEKEEKVECDGVRTGEPKQVSEVRKSCDSSGSNSKKPKQAPINSDMPLSPESRKKNELCSYLKLMDLKRTEPKNGNVLTNRRSTRVKNLMMLSEKKELEKKLADVEEITSEYSKYSFEELNMDVRVRMEETNDSYWLRQNFRPEFVPVDVISKITDFEDSMDAILDESDRKRFSVASNKENRTKPGRPKLRQSIKWLRVKKLRMLKQKKEKSSAVKVKNDPLAGRLLRSMAMRKLRSRPKFQALRKTEMKKKGQKKVEKVESDKAKEDGGKERRANVKDAENKGKDKSDAEPADPVPLLTNGPNIIILTPQELSQTIVTEEKPSDNETSGQKVEETTPVLSEPEPMIVPDVSIIPQEPPPEAVNEGSLLRNELIRSPPKEQKSAIQYKEHVQKEQRSRTPDVGPPNVRTPNEQSDGSTNNGGEIRKYRCPTPLVDHNYSLDPMYIDVPPRVATKRKKRPQKHRRINLRGFSEKVLKHKSVKIETGESSEEGSSETDDSHESDDETPVIIYKIKAAAEKCNGATTVDLEDPLPVMNERHLIPVQRNAVKSLHRNLVQNRRRETKRLEAANGSDQERGMSQDTLSPRNSARSDQKRSSHSIAISLREGPIVDCHYFDYNLVVTQDRLISFWNRSPLGSVLDSQEMWIPRGHIRRLALDEGCVFKKSRETVISGENSFAYVELWTKEHKSDRRERPVADVFAVVYFWKNRLTAPEKKFLQLENINGFADDVRYVVLKNAPSILVSWRSMKDETPISMVHCYHLASDFQTISSVRELESVEHVVSSLHNIEDCDTLAIGYGEQKITIWNLEDGYVVATIDISSEDSPEMRNVWVKCDRGFLFLLQHYPGGLFKLLAINGMNHSWKKLQIFRPPSLRFDRLHGVCIDSGILTSFYGNGILCWNIQTGSLIMEETCKETRYLPSGKHIVTITNNNQVRVKNSLSYLITNYDFS